MVKPKIGYARTEKPYTNQGERMGVRIRMTRMPQERGCRKGQLMVEYAVMFTVIVAVILFAATNWFKPAVNRFFNTTSNVIDEATRRVQNNF